MEKADSSNQSKRKRKSSIKEEKRLKKKIRREKEEEEWLIKNKDAEGEEWQIKSKYVKCIHCKFRQKREKFDICRENICSYDASMCLECYDIVCDECHDRLYENDKRYESYHNSTGYEEFCCMKCLESEEIFK